MYSCGSPGIPNPGAFFRRQNMSKLENSNLSVSTPIPDVDKDRRVVAAKEILAELDEAGYLVKGASASEDAIMLVEVILATYENESI